LSIVLEVQDDPESSSHINGFSVWVEKHVLSAVCASIPINVLELVAKIGSGWVGRVVYTLSSWTLRLDGSTMAPIHGLTAMNFSPEPASCASKKS
jgi:hypothetical protein